MENSEFTLDYICLDDCALNCVESAYVKHLYKTICLSKNYGLCFIFSSYRTNYYEHLEGNNRSLSPLFTEM